MNFSGIVQQKYPQILWITLWIAQGVLRKPVLPLILSLVLLNFSAARAPIAEIAASDDKK
jgi:hypothetical protein